VIVTRVPESFIMPYFAGASSKQNLGALGLCCLIDKSLFDLYSFRISVALVDLIGMHPLTAYALGIVIAAIALYAVYETLAKYNAKYNPRGLPGPTLVPWLGRVHDLPINFMWLKFDEWARKYGPIYRTKMLGANFIIISDEKIAEEILVKKAKIYSDRPEIKSLFDAKSTYGSMEYLPLMGKNRKYSLDCSLSLPLIVVRVLGTSTKAHSCLSHRSSQRPLLRHHGIRSKAMDGQIDGEARRFCFLTRGHVFQGHVPFDLG